jgi:UDP-N-acetylglucosamine diphosphorylase/glucosamine-1-phosphate N-acetyltransferase
VAGEIRACSIGEICRVHGEISASVVLGHANKGHEGFVGHSYLGRWVNLGAGTTTSNLKNTYGTVSLWTPRGVRDTGAQFLGTLFGDHAKTGIGLRLTTGSVVGAGANVYDTMPPKAVPPFAWGGGAPYGTYRVDKLLDVTARAMARRKVELDGRGRELLRSAYAEALRTRDAWSVAAGGDA